MPQLTELVFFSCSEGNFQLPIFQLRILLEAEAVAKEGGQEAEPEDVTNLLGFQADLSAWPQPHLMSSPVQLLAPRTGFCRWLMWPSHILVQQRLHMRPCASPQGVRDLPLLFRSLLVH